MAIGRIISDMPLGGVTLAAFCCSFVLGALAVVLGIMRGRRASRAGQALVAGEQFTVSRCALWPELGAAVATLLPVVLTAAGVFMARQAQLAGFGAQLHSRQEALAEGIAAQLSTQGMGCGLLLLLLPLLAVAWALLLWGRGRCRGISRAAELAKEAKAVLPPAARAYLDHPGPPLWQLMVLTLGLGEGVLSQLCLALLQYTSGLISTFGAVAGSDPQKWFEMMDVGIKEAQQAAEPFLWVALAGLVVLAMVAFALLGPLSAGRKRTHLAPELASKEQPVSWITTAAVTCVLLAGAAGCLILARPFRQENQMPLVKRTGCSLAKLESAPVLPKKKEEPGDVVPDSFADFVPSVDGKESPQPAAPVDPGSIKLPGHVGPDVPVQALQVHLDHDAMEVEGQPVSLKKLAHELHKHGERQRKIEKMTNGKMPFGGRARLIAHRTLPASRLLAVLSAGAKEGFHRWLLVFSGEHTVTRPLLGPLRFACPSAARIQLRREGQKPVDAPLIQVGPGKGSPAALLPAKGKATRVLLKLAPTVSYERWSAVAVEGRKRGMEVWLQLPASE